MLAWHPLVIVGIPAYNEELYIAETLDSVLAQTHQDFLVFISDNHSSDGTQNICEHYAKMDSRICYVRQDENVGSCRNFQYLLDNSSSPYFMWLGSHDLIHKDFLKDHITALQRMPNASMSCSQIKWIDHVGDSLKISELSFLPKIKGRPWQRYLAAVASIPDNEYSVVNSLFRRNALDGFGLKPVFGSDHIVVARLAYKGLFNYERKPLYASRAFFGEREETWMQRVNPHSPGTCLNFELFRQAYCLDLAMLNCHALGKRLLMPALIICLHYRWLKTCYAYQGKQRIENRFLFVMVHYSRRVGRGVLLATRKLIGLSQVELRRI
jgi:glycosyltransferase involved in cell wall biosynthesis